MVASLANSKNFDTKTTLQKPEHTIWVFPRCLMQGSLPFWLTHFLGNKDEASII